MADPMATPTERALSKLLAELPSWEPPMRLERKELFWEARIDTYPFNACRRLTREAARRRAVARARYLRGGGLRALLDAHRQGSILTVV